MTNLTARWVDRGYDPQCPPNPAYPDGIDVDCSDGAEATCRTELRHPTPRCGLWLIKCKLCDQTVMLTTAGRPDDPRSIKVACVRPERVQ